MELLVACVMGLFGAARLMTIGLSQAAPLTQGKKHTHPDEPDTPLWVLGIASMALVLLGGAFAGLTIAYV